MVDSKQIKAYTQDASGQLVPLTADSLILEFPSGASLEITWDTPHPDDPRPVCAEVWGGRRAPLVQSEHEINEAESKARTRATSVAILPSAGNLVLVHPYSFSRRKGFVAIR
jgi:hypothetical protein